MLANIIHITGASGAGTTTLAKAICGRFGHAHFDTDDFYWEPTNPPFTQKRAVDQCQRLLAEAIDSAEKCVISGSLTEWGDIFLPKFGLIIYVSTPAEVRLQRLQAREHHRAWLKRAPCPVARVDGTAPAEEMFRELDY